MFNNIKTHFLLLMQSPKDYMYSFKYTDKKPIKIYPYNPSARVSAERLISKLQKICPCIQCYLIGSVGLQIEGRGDVDIYAVVNPYIYKDTKENLSFIFGIPQKDRKDFSEWKFVYEELSTELVLTNPLNKRFRSQIRLFNLLRNNQVYLYEYKKLKKRLNGKLHKEYARERMAFFNRILK